MTSTASLTSAPPAHTTASCSPGILDWSINSRHQDPCLVASKIAGVCFEYGYRLNPLPPEGNYQYRGISPAEDAPCMCNTVYYSLESACSACQHILNSWDSWRHWSANCSKTFTTYPQGIPPGVAIPAWAYLDVIVGDTFNISLAQSYAGLSDSVAPPPPTATFTTTTRIQTVIYSTLNIPSTSPAITVPEKNPSPNTGAIVGGVIGGLTIIILATLLIRYWRSRDIACPAARAYYTGNTPQPSRSPKSIGYYGRLQSSDRNSTPEPNLQHPAPGPLNSSEAHMQGMPLAYSSDFPAPNPTYGFPSNPVIGQTYYTRLPPDPLHLHLC